MTQQFYKWVFNWKLLNRIKLCPFYFNNSCKDNTNCKFAHGVSELRLGPSLKRTQLCQTWRRTGWCNDAKCRFAHGFGELRSTPDLYKTKLCTFWLKGDCRYGDECRHAHGEEELRVKESEVLVVEPAFNSHETRNLAVRHKAEQKKTAKHGSYTKASSKRKSKKPNSSTKINSENIRLVHNETKLQKEPSCKAHPNPRKKSCSSTRSSYEDTDAATPKPGPKDQQRGSALVENEWYVGCFDQHIFLPLDVAEAPAVITLPDAGVDKLLSEPVVCSDGLNDIPPSPIPCHFEIWGDPPTTPSMSQMVNASPFAPVSKTLGGSTNPSVDTLQLVSEDSTPKVWDDPPGMWEPAHQHDDGTSLFDAWLNCAIDAVRDKENADPNGFDAPALQVARELGFPFQTLDDLLTFLQAC
ncbi:MAG: uncharacterized protein KVP18_000495 [Porospora cf. gigantea A]|uniref:uncharacterized protein n=1 Tax=Porospora cf. gigantea A TaxID=2853593 RepID=UPI00355A7823|nr:MAG: hypothetical protein KVP18_000495 [Porospora cf. gigantea A]